MACQRGLPKPVPSAYSRRLLQSLISVVGGAQALKSLNGFDGKERQPGRGRRTVDAVRERGPPVLDLPADGREGAEGDPVPQHVGASAPPTMP